MLTPRQEDGQLNRQIRRKEERTVGCPGRKQTVPFRWVSFPFQAGHLGFRILIMSMNGLWAGFLDLGMDPAGSVFF